MGRAGLTPDLVVAEAAALADEVGYEGVTLKALADRFGVASPSLYKHVGGLDDVRRRLAVHATRELGVVLAEAAAGGAPADASQAGLHEVRSQAQAEPQVTAQRGSRRDPRRDTLRALARAYRSHARAHPGRYQATLRAPAPDDTEHRTVTGAVLETVLTLLSGYGLTGDDAVDAARAVRSALHGFVALEAAGGFGLPRDVDRSFARLVDGLHMALSAWPTD